MGEFFVSVSALALGIMFLASGFSKLRDMDGFVLGVMEYEILPPKLALAYGRVLPFAELLCGLGLLLGLVPLVFGTFATMLLLSFLTAVSVNLARGRRLDCHCFGSQSSEPLGLVTLSRLVILLVLAITVAASSAGTLLAPRTQDFLPTILLAVGVAVGLYILGVVPALLRIWRTEAVPGATVNGGRVSLKNQPLGRPISVNSGDDLNSNADDGEREEVGS